MKELIAKEFMFLFLGILVAIPVGFIFLAAINFTPYTEIPMTKDNSVLEMDLLLIGAIIGFIGVYIARLAVWGVKILLGAAK